MILMTPFFITIAIYVLAAIVPAIFLMREIYRLDSFEKEPNDLLLSCVVQGVLAAFAAIFLEMIGQTILSRSGILPTSRKYIIILAFCIVAVAEEGAKFFFLYRRTWREPNFDYRFDGIVYSAYVSLGFAAFENIKYVFSYGLAVAFPRAILSIPGHLGFAIVFGYFYGRARIAASRGKRSRSKTNLIIGYILAVLMHGFYDTCAMTGTKASTIVFIAFVVIMYIFIIRLVKRDSVTNEPIYSMFVE